MVCRELLFRNLLDQIWSQTDASCGPDPFAHTFTGSEHRLSTLDSPGTLSCTPILYLALGHCSDEQGNEGYLEQD